MWQSFRMKRSWYDADGVTPGCSVEASTPPAHLSGSRLLLSFTHLLHQKSRISARHPTCPPCTPTTPTRTQPMASRPPFRQELSGAVSAHITPSPQARLERPHRQQHQRRPRDVPRGALPALAIEPEMQIVIPVFQCRCLKKRARVRAGPTLQARKDAPIKGRAHRSFRHPPRAQSSP